MMIASTPAGLRLVTQNDHAHFASELLSLWRADGLPEHPRRESLLFATREHDNGWRGFDAAPLRRDDGRPHDFRSTPDRERREIWRQGTHRYLERDPWAALLILEHALVLHQDELEAPAWCELADTWHRQRTELLEQCGATADELDADYRFLEIADLASLMVCCSSDDPFERRGLSLERRGDELTLDPFPLVGATTFRIPCRHIPDRPYASDSELGVELASARWSEMTVRVLPAGTL